jgi:hypothetical protein
MDGTRHPNRDGAPNSGHVAASLRTVLVGRRQVTQGVLFGLQGLSRQPQLLTEPESIGTNYLLLVLIPEEFSGCISFHASACAVNLASTSSVSISTSSSASLFPISTFNSDIWPWGCVVRLAAASWSGRSAIIHDLRKPQVVITLFESTGRSSRSLCPAQRRP